MARPKNPRCICGPANQEQKKPARGELVLDGVRCETATKTVKAQRAWTGGVGHEERS